MGKPTADAGAAWEMRISSIFEYTYETTADISHGEKTTTDLKFRRLKKKYL
jgi:hypothetical protein